MATAIGDGLFVTAAHVVAGADTVEVIDADGRRSAAQVVTFDPLLDIAALRAVDAAVETVAIRPDRAAADESGAVVVSDVDDSLEWVEVTVVRRATIETTDIYRDADVARAGFEIEASIDPGDSGAAVHLPGGIVGVVWARSTVHPDRAWAIDIPDRFLDEAVVARSPVDTGPCP
jgi:S1-C subfamily serine protease